MIVPDTHDKNHSSVERIAHNLKSTTVLERVGVAKGSLLSITEVVRDRVVRVQARNFRSRVLDDLPVLDVDTADFGERSRGCVVRGDELCDDREFRLGIDRQSGTEEGLVAHTP